MRTQGDSFSSFPARSRRDWLQQWQQNNPGKPLPCSAKAVYRLADSKHAYAVALNLPQIFTGCLTELDLRELKERAFQVDSPSSYRIRRVLCTYLRNLTARHQIAHRRERPIRGFFKLLGHIRERSQGNHNKYPHPCLGTDGYIGRLGRSKVFLRQLDRYPRLGRHAECMAPD